MDPDSEQYTSFVCDQDKFIFKKMAFRLKIAPLIFVRLVNKVLGEARGVFADVYIDDIIIFSKTWQEHLKHIRYVLERLRQAGLTANRKKCQFGKTTIKYLGYIVGPNGVEIDRDKLAPILDYPEPKTVKQVRRFLGTVGWYRRFIESFSEIAEPLNKLLRNSKSVYSIPWKQEQQDSFDELKKLVANTVTLAFPNFNEKFIVRTDASKFGLSGVLSQKMAKKDQSLLQVEAYQTPNAHISHQKSSVAVFYLLSRNLSNF